MSGNGEKPNNELYALNDMLEGVEPAERVAGRHSGRGLRTQKPEPQPEAPEPAPEEAASTESASETETAEEADEVVPIQAWQAGETRTIHVPPVVRDDDAEQPDVLSDPDQKRRGKKGKVVAFPGVQTPAEPPKKAAPPRGRSRTPPPCPRRCWTQSLPMCPTSTPTSTARTASSPPSGSRPKRSPRRPGPPGGLPGQVRTGGDR